MDEMYLPSSTEINIPWLMLTPVNPIDVINDAPFSSKQADTTAVEFTTKPRNLPVLALVFETTFEPV